MVQLPEPCDEKSEAYKAGYKNICEIGKERIRRAGAKIKEENPQATELDTNEAVSVYVKLPDGFYISTPVGHYNPDWAIAFKEGTVKHIYFIAETKGAMSSMQLREVEKAKIHCAKEHFKAISSDSVVYDVVDGYESLLKLVTA